MVSSRARPTPHLRALLSVLAAGLGLALSGAAHAGRNDLQLLNLCDQAPAPSLNGYVECSQIHRNASGTIIDPTTGQPGPVRLDDANGLVLQSRFRSLMSELGVVAAPRLQTPADTLGYAGFQVSFELGTTKINNTQPYWHGVEGYSAGQTPDSYITTLGAFVRKGMWLPLPAFEFGAGALNIVGSRMYVVQGYAKLALQEGFHGWWLPSLAVRGSASQLLGTDQVDLNVYGVDVLISKAFGIGGTWRLEPFLGWNVLFIDARSGVIDATPGCDAALLEQGMPGGRQCGAGQANSGNDTFANFTFPQQDVITRQRWSGGLKLKLAVVFLAVEYDFIPAGHSRDGKQPEIQDQSGSQQSFSLSTGFDF
jgi:hypothetical protein